MNNNNKMLEAALTYAGIGWAVFPLKPGAKTPITSHGCKDATTDTQIITRWWQQNPDANLGLATGFDSVVVLDVDVKGNKNGKRSLAKLMKEHDDLPTLVVQTPTGGLHLYFWPQPDHIYKNSVDFRDGLDFRCDGGYVVAPPSQIGGVYYEWV